MRSSSRSTVFSPQIVDVVDTRTSRSRPSIVHLELAVLRTAPLDDVHVRHDLDAAHERRAHLGRQLDHLLERAVDAEPHAHALVGRLDVHVGRAVAQRLRDDLVDDLDDRRVVGDAAADSSSAAACSVRDVALGERLDVGGDRRQRAVGLVDARRAPATARRG